MKTQQKAGRIFTSELSYALWARYRRVLGTPSNEALLALITTLPRIGITPRPDQRFLKYSRVMDATSGDRAKSAIKFGAAISPVSVSATSHTKLTT